VAVAVAARAVVARSRFSSLHGFLTFAASKFILPPSGFFGRETEETFISETFISHTNI
jgi:hypothetical protein